MNVLIRICKELMNYKTKLYIYIYIFKVGKDGAEFEVDKN